MTEHGILSSLIDKSIRNRLPLFASVELTDRCNLRCVHCYVTRRPRNELPIEELSSLFGQLSGIGTMFLTLTGGEIFTRTDIKEILKLVSGFNFAIKIFTNGSLIDNEMADCVAAISPWTVEISIYGHTADVHDAVTGVKGSFAKTRRAIDLLNERSVKLCLKTVWIEENIQSARGIINMAKTLGFPLRGSALISPTFDGDGRVKRHRLSDENLRYLASLFSEDLTDENVDIQELPEKGTGKEIVCGAGRNTLAVSTDGEVRPCLLWPESAGNVKESDLLSIWNNASIFNKLRSYTVSEIAGCEECDYYDSCVFCPAIALLEQGSMHKALPEACRIARVFTRRGNT